MVNAGESAGWTESSIPNQAGRVVLVTGANSGIGMETARALAHRGAHVVLACRDGGRGAEAVESIGSEGPSGTVDVLGLDLADLGSIREAARTFSASHERLDLLINNAGIMATAFGRSIDGFERQLATNHLGHFALTGLVLRRLLATPGSRVVTVSSGAHRFGRINFDDLQSERSYSPWRAYGQSKLANLLFTYELQRRLESTGSSTLAVAAHPGVAATNLFRPTPTSLAGRLARVTAPAARVFSQSAAQGALPTLRAATDPAARGGGYYGPSGFAELRGDAVLVKSGARSHDVDTATRLWRMSEELTDTSYDFS